MSVVLEVFAVVDLFCCWLVCWLVGLVGLFHFCSYFLFVIVTAADDADAAVVAAAAAAAGYSFTLFSSVVLVT